MIVCRPVAGPTELAAHHRVRHAVFVAEQGLFRDDHDDHDDDPGTVHLLGLVDGRPAGTVRLYPHARQETWKGDRLAVLSEHRHAGIGAPLVRLAVATAGALGGREMVALVQAHHTVFFTGLGWTPVDRPYPYLGVPHQGMRIDLRHGAHTDLSRAGA